MKVNSINNYNPTFKSAPVAYPEFRNGYSSTKANKADVVSSNLVSGFSGKLARAYRLLFNPEISNSADKIKNNIDKVFDDSKVGRQINVVA